MSNVELDNINFDDMLANELNSLVDEGDVNIDESGKQEEPGEIDELFSGVEEFEETEETEEPIVNEEEETEVEEVDNDSILSKFALELRENGILPDMEEDSLKNINSFEDLLETMGKQLEAVHSNWQAEYKKNIIGNLVAEGLISQDQVNVNERKFFKKEDVETNEDSARAMLKEYYKMKNLPDRKIERLLDNSIDLNEDALDIYDDYKSLVKEEEGKVEKILEERQKKQIELQQQLENKIKETTYSYKEFVPGQKLSDKVKQDVHKNIPVVLKKINDDLGKYAPIIAYLDTYGLLDGDFSKIMKVKQTEAVNKFTEALKTKGVSPSPSGIKRTAFESLKRK